MIKQQYLEQISDLLEKNSIDKNLSFFIYGSGLVKERFGDVDIGVEGSISKSDLNRLRQVFSDSSLPYFVELVDFNKVAPGFKRNVLNNKILWIKR